ncbi:phage tail tape measure protein [Nesterenkonia aurantiaca]|uniref:phage tail tape measure protein n=1 Tax=Nesterenkonia aurantiaca TaxID=1436010 RepID=UPI003EE6DC4D
MANRTITLSLKANVDGMVNGVKTAQRAATDAGRDLESFRKNNEQTWNAAGRGLVAFGTAAVAGLGVAGKAAMDWESAWVGVQKTNEGTAEQMADLESGLREMTSVLPASHAEIAAVAEAAGQLGIGIDDVEEFTKVMIDMGEATNMSADEAATSLARFANIMGTSSSDFDRIGSAIVELGNNFATTESEIVAMSMRIAGAGAQLGLTEGEVLGFATALSSVGIEAAAGGTAISKVMIDIAADVDKGGEGLEKWAEVAGMSAEEFRRAFQDDAAGAMASLVEGLGAAEEQGMTTLGMLEELGIKEVRTRDAMLRLAGASDLFANALSTGNDAFAENTALMEEAEKRYQTAESKIAIAWNGIKDAAIDAGAVIVPAMVGMVEQVADLAAWFSALPEPAQTAITTLGGLAGVTAAGLGGFMLLLPKMQASLDALRSIGPVGTKAAGAITNVGKVAGVAAVGFIALETASKLAGTGLDDIGSASDFERALHLLAEDALAGANSLDELASASGSSLTSVHGLGDALKTVDASGFVKGLDWIGSMGGIFDREVGLAEEALSNFDAALTGLAEGGNFDLAAEGFKRLVMEGEVQGKSMETVAESVPDYIDAIGAAALEQGILLSETDLLKVAMGELTPEMQRVKNAADEAAKQDALESALGDVGLAADGAVESLSDYLGLLFETGLAAQSVMQAQSGYQESLRGVGDAVDQITDPEGGLGGMNKVLNEAKDGFDLTTEAGALAQDSFLGIADSGRDLATAMADAGDSQDDIQDSLKGTYKDLIAAGEQFGLTAEQSKALAREVLGVPDGVTIDSWMSTEAEETAKRISTEVNDIPDFTEVMVVVDDNGALGPIQITKEELASIQDRTVDVDVTDNGSVLTVQGGIDNVEGKTEYIYVEDDGTARVVQSRIDSVTGKTEYVYVDDDGTVQVVQGQIDGVQDGSADITAVPQTANAESALNNTARNRTSTITQVVKRSNLLTNTSPGGPTLNSGGFTGGVAGRDFGFPKLRNGGRLPYTGLGTDMILGVGSDGRPIAEVDDGEWVIRERSANKCDSVLDRINRDHPSVQHLAGYADGSRVASGAMQAQRLVMAGSAGGSGGGGGDRSNTPIEIKINAYGPNVQDVINQGGDLMFRRLREEGVPVGKW